MPRLDIELTQIERSPLRPTTPSREESVELLDEGLDDYALISTSTVCSEARKRVFWLGLFLIGLWSAAFGEMRVEHRSLSRATH